MLTIHNFVKPTAALLLVTLIAAFALGMVYHVTDKPIAQQKAKTEAETVAQLLPGIDDTKTETVERDDTSVTQIITGYTAGKINGYAISASPKGYSGAVDIMVAFDTTGVIQGMQILSHSETPGLGANAALPSFTDQYKGKSGKLQVVKTKGALAADEVEAITSATITSNAVTSGVNDATDYLQDYLKASKNP